MVSRSGCVRSKPLPEQSRRVDRIKLNMSDKATAFDFSKGIALHRMGEKLAGPYFKWQFSQVAPYVGRRVADVGCGLGNMTEFLLDRDIYLGIDTCEEFIEILQTNHNRASNVKTIIADVLDDSFPTILQKNDVDTILSFNLLEHLEDDRRAAVNLVKSLPRRGYLLLLVPAMPCIYGALDKWDGHFRRYTKQTMRNLFAALPVQIEKLHYFNCIGALGWWLKGRCAPSPEHSEYDYKLMNLCIPVLSRLERIISPPIGLSIVTIARVI